MSTLKLGGGGGAVKKEPVPVFDRDGHYGEVGGMDGAKYIQGKNLFGPGGNFIREADKNQWLAPLTPEQERNRLAQKARNSKFFASAKPRINEAGVPSQVIAVERENSQARAAEEQAA